MRSQWAIPIQSHLHTSFLNLYGSHKSWRRSQCTKITRIRRIHGPLAGPDWPKHCTTCSMWHVTMGSEPPKGVIGHRRAPPHAEFWDAGFGPSRISPLFGRNSFRRIAPQPNNPSQVSLGTAHRRSHARCMC